LYHNKKEKGEKERGKKKNCWRIGLHLSYSIMQQFDICEILAFWNIDLVSEIRGHFEVKGF